MGFCKVIEQNIYFSSSPAVLGTKRSKLFFVFYYMASNYQGLMKHSVGILQDGTGRGGGVMTRAGPRKMV